MEDLRLSQIPVTRRGMLVRKPAAEVYEAIVNPDITTKFWFTRSSGRLERLKALLEHDVKLNLTADRYPKGVEEPPYL